MLVPSGLYFNSKIVAEVTADTLRRVPNNCGDGVVGDTLERLLEALWSSVTSGNYEEAASILNEMGVHRHAFEDQRVFLLAIDAAKHALAANGIELPGGDPAVSLGEHAFRALQAASRVCVETTDVKDGTQALSEVREAAYYAALGRYLTRTLTAHAEDESRAPKFKEAPGKLVDEMAGRCG